MSRRRRRSSGGLAGNPFVVFADMTIALAFIFAVHGLASVASSSQALVVAKRKARQTSLREDVSRVLLGAFRGSRAKLIRPTDAEGTYLRVDAPDGSDLAEVWANGNFVRISVFRPVFQRAGSAVDATGRSLYRAMGSVLRHHAPAFAYLYVHGIVERNEGLGKADALSLSRLRADRLMDILRAEKVVGGTDAPDRRADGQGVPMVPAKYAIAYGTGEELYTSGQAVGRADVVLFYEENLDDGP